MSSSVVSTVGAAGSLSLDSGELMIVTFELDSALVRQGLGLSIWFMLYWSSAASWSSCSSRLFP